MSAPATYPGFPPTPPPPTPPTPQYPGQPSYPVAPGQLPGQYPVYPQQTAPAYPQQYPMPPGYPQPTMAPPAPQLAQGSIDDFYNQPSGGNGKALSFPTINTRYVGIVTRPITSADIQQQTTPPNAGSIPQFYKDGRPKFVMKVPLQMQPSPAFPDGLATWFVKGQARDELVRAMAEAGAPAGPPEHLAVIDVTFVSERPVPGMNASKQFRIVYTRPEGAAQQPAQQVAQPVPPPAPQAVPPAPAPAAQPAYAPPPMDPAQAQAAANVAAQFPQAAPVAPSPTPQAPPAAPAQVDPTAGMDAAQQALLARLTGQSAG